MNDNNKNILSKNLYTRINNSRINYISYLFVTLAIVLRLLQPQNVLSILGLLKIQLLVGLICSLFLISKFKQSLVGATKYVFIFFLVTGFLVVLGKVWEPFIHNDRVSFFRWSDLSLLIFSITLPLTVFFQHGKRIRNLVFWLGFSGLLLSIYILTHQGHGPGSWLLDENDACLAIIFLLPFSLFLWRYLRNNFSKLLMLISILGMFGGVVGTSSRGGFLGFVVVLSYYFFKSKNKIAILIFSFMIGLLGLYFVPSEYWHEVQSISEVSSGTAKTRLDYWKAAVKLWLHPPHILAGVGIGNSRQRLGEVVGEVTFYGHEVHSMYFQVLSELGLVGIVFCILMIGGSIFDNLKNIKQNKKTINIINLNLDKLKKQQQIKVSIIGREILFSTQVLTAINASWCGVLFSGAFISVFYYPPIWILIGLSVGVQVYIKKLNELLESFFNEYGSSDKNSD